MKGDLVRSTSIVLLCVLIIGCIGFIVYLIVRRNVLAPRMRTISEYKGLEFTVNETVMNEVFDRVGVWKNPMRTFIDEEGKRFAPLLDKEETRVVFVLSKTPQTREVQVMSEDDPTIMISGRVRYDVSSKTRMSTCSPGSARLSSCG